MKLITLLVGILILLVLVVMVLYVLFGQITVRKLRKNPETKHELGIELASGWDILNVAQALSIPTWLNNKFMKSSLSAFAADAAILSKHTNKFDKLLARLFYVLFVFSGFSLILLGILELIGVFD